MEDIYNITQSIGKLNTTQLEPLYGIPVNKSLYKFLAESKNLRRWIDYGTLSDDEATFYQNGESKYIIIDGYTFDNRVFIHEKFVATQDTVRHYIKLNGSTPEGKIFEIELCDGVKDVHRIVKVIYGINAIHRYLRLGKARLDSFELFKNKYKNLLNR